MTSREQLTAAEVIAGHDLTGKETIVTGGYSGIGYETAKALASAGARVVIAGHDLTKGLKAVAELQAATSNEKIVFRPLDLNSMDSVTTWVRKHVATGKPLHILVNNAGVMAGLPLRRTVEGFESQLGINYLAHFVFTVGLLPCLHKAGDARVAILTSSGHRHSDINYDDPNYERRPYDPTEAYGQSKTADALLAVGFTARHGSPGLSANAVMPGAISTPLQRHLSTEDLRARGWIDADGHVGGNNWKTPEQGAATSVWAAVAPELRGVSGRYLEDCAIARSWTETAGHLPRGRYLPYAMDENNADRLWELSEHLLLDTKTTQ